MNQQPLVSVIIPSFNREKLIADTLQSVLDQTYHNWECIIVDDGSTDATIEVVQRFADKDNRFQLYKRHREPKGAPTCRNIGLDKSEGDYIIFLDSDDLLKSECLENRLVNIKKHPNHDFWVFPTLMMKEGKLTNWFNKFSSESDLIRFLRLDAPWCIFGPIWTKKSISHLRFDESLLAWQDWELHVRAILLKHKYWKSEQSEWDNIYIIHNLGNIGKEGRSVKFVINKLQTLKKVWHLLVKTQNKKLSHHIKPLFYKLILWSNDNDDYKTLNQIMSFMKENKVMSPAWLNFWHIYSKVDANKSAWVNWTKYKIIDRIIRLLLIENVARPKTTLFRIPY